MPFQDAPEPPVTPQLRAECASTVVVITSDGRILRGGEATAFLLGALGYRFWSAFFRHPPGSWLMALGYLILSRNRAFFARFLFRGE